MEEVAQTEVQEAQTEVAQEPQGDQNAVQQEEGQEAAQEVAEKPKEEPIPKGVQRRIDRAVRQKYEAEARANELARRVQELEAKAQPREVSDKEPRLEQYDNIEDYVAAKARFIAKQELDNTLTARERAEAEAKAQAAQAVSAETWAKRAAAAKAEMPDFDEVVSSLDVVVAPAVFTAIQESDLGPKIVYYLATNPDEAEDIARMNVPSAIRAIGRLEAKLESAKAPVTKAPAPINPVGQKAKVEKSPADMTPAEFAKWRKGFIAQRGSR